MHTHTMKTHGHTHAHTCTHTHAQTNTPSASGWFRDSLTVCSHVGYWKPCPQNNMLRLYAVVEERRGGRERGGEERGRKGRREGGKGGEEQGRRMGEEDTLNTLLLSCVCVCLDPR